MACIIAQAIERQVALRSDRASKSAKGTDNNPTNGTIILTHLDITTILRTREGSLAESVAIESKLAYISVFVAK